MTARIGPEDISEAAVRVAGHIRETPILRMEPDAFGVRGALTLKLECLQHSGSFKARGAFNSLLSTDIPVAGVITASGGNHGGAVAYAARALGHKARIFVPTTSPRAKIDRLRGYGADVTEIGDAYADAYEASQAVKAETGAVEIHAYDQPATVAGQGTVAREIERQTGGLDTVLVAVGGGGLIAGIASWLQGRVRVVGVETEGTPTLTRALAEGRPVDIEVGGLAADALGAKRIGEIAYATARDHVDRVVLVEDDSVRAAQKALWANVRVVAEPGGATALAALMAGAYTPEKAERVAVLVCGANTDPATIV
ncbi:MAG: threonine/serine dehydratase [Rhodospirillaceae bacterium]|jgi:threonine dehydratase|nr:threonine/serine dehydratase [Rhodospirillaceae bacterium]